MTGFLQAIPSAAASPYALVAYAIAAVLFLVAGARLQMARILMAKIEAVPQTERRRSLEIATGTVLPTHISPEQWIRLRKIQWTFLLLAAILVAALTVVVIAIVNPARATPEDLKKVDQGLKSKVDESTAKIVTTVQDVGLANLETIFPLAVRVDRDVDGTIMHLNGSPRQRVISYDSNLKPMQLYWGDRFDYFVFSEHGMAAEGDAQVWLEVVANGKATRLPLLLDPYGEHELRIPGSSPQPMEAFLINESGIQGIGLKITVYSADRERGRAQFRNALMNSALSSAARRTYLEVISDGVRLRGSASDSGLVLRTLRVGTYVKVTEQQEGWCHVRLPEGREGWLKCDLMALIH